MNAYITSDRIGIETGGGKVTQNEIDAMREMGKITLTWDRKELGESSSVWDDDKKTLLEVSKYPDVGLAHFYAGTFSKTVEHLRSKGAIVSYTAAAHDIDVSRQEHEKLQIPFNYEHLTNPELWSRYVAGYLNASMLICPSPYSARIMQRYGYKGPIKIIPHGCDVPDTPCDYYPNHFTVGYMGAVGPDKGLIYLLQAWRELGFKDATLLLAGSQSKSQWMTGLIKYLNVQNVQCLGWVEDISHFYNRLSLYVQPSASEGFGCEILEAMAHNRPVIASRGAGASYLVPEYCTVRACDHRELANKIDEVRRMYRENVPSDLWRETARKYTWDKVRAMYVEAWNLQILGG